MRKMHKIRERGKTLVSNHGYTPAKKSLSALFNKLLDEQGNLKNRPMTRSQLKDVYHDDTSFTNMLDNKKVTEKANNEIACK